MIFLTVGTQLPFDRLVAAVDDWAGRHPDVEVFAQIGPTTLVPRHMQHAPFLPPARADDLMRRSEVIVAHAGMGSVLTAQALNKPIVIVPRHAALGEHRNDHQLATASWLESRPGVIVAWEPTDVAALLDDRTGLADGSALRPALGSVISPVASGPLVERLRAYVAAAPRRRR
jgi:UDP-N-acetylglucosamine transferase subunit ALG13